ncbi:hypothetical protein ACGFZP_05140 [Kitasatospora sp. NPDC048239]|uniref:hypothetical protein n=1 Tax=Kitasatospora sp. NPDC048239 TaxID=3364046 RepID=UPI0037243FA2
MARTAVAYSSFLPNSSVTDASLTAVTLNPGTNNGHSIAKAVPELTVLRVAVGATGGNITVKAGTYPPAIAAGQGDLVVNVASNTISWIGPFESGRFLQNDGSMLIDVAAAVVPGTITALRVPRNT